jgi:hypothetical protein
MHGRTARASSDECAQRATTLTMRELAQRYLAARGLAADLERTSGRRVR